MTDSKPETRKFRRVTFNAPVTLSTPDGTWTTHVLDISLKGVLLERPSGYSGTIKEGDCHVELPLDEQQSIRLSCRIVHRNSRYMGFEWTNIDSTSLSHLCRLLELNLGDSQTVDRELSALI